MNLRPPPSVRDAAVDEALVALPLALSTTWLTLEAAGAELVADDERLLVCTPGVPGHLWSDAIQVRDATSVDDAAHWLEAALLDLPAVPRPAFGLPARPDPERWHALPCPGVDDRALEWHPQHWVALAAGQVTPPGPLADGYRVERVATGAQWDQWVARPSPGGREYQEAWTATKRRRQDAGVAAWFVGMLDGRLVASGGITLCDVGGRRVGRFEDIQTDPAHRGRGIASHLLAAAHRWALDEGADAGVLVADADGEAIGLYERLGFEPVDEAWMVLPRLADPTREAPAQCSWSPVERGAMCARRVPRGRPGGGGAS